MRGLTKRTAIKTISGGGTMRMETASLQDTVARWHDIPTVSLLKLPSIWK